MCQDALQVSPSILGDVQKENQQEDSDETSDNYLESTPRKRRIVISSKDEDHIGHEEQMKQLGSNRSSKNYHTTALMGFKRNELVKTLDIYAKDHFVAELNGLDSNKTKPKKQTKK